jgi:hypothetical protein
MMMKWLLWLLFCLPAFAQVPEHVQVSYEIFSRGMKIGQLDETYNRIKDRYTLSSTTTPLGLLAAFKPEKLFLASSGRVDNLGLHPLHFESKREGKPDKDLKAEFDWSTSQLTLTHQDKHTKLPLPDGTQDRLSAMYQFMFVPRDGLNTLDFAMTNGNKLDNYHYAIGAHEKLDTPAGQFDSIYLDSQDKPGENRTEIWLCAEPQLPCKMIITESNGDKYTQILSGIKITP